MRDASARSITSAIAWPGPGGRSPRRSPGRRVAIQVLNRSPAQQHLLEPLRTQRDERSPVGVAAQIPEDEVLVPRQDFARQDQGLPAMRQAPEIVGLDGM